MDSVILFFGKATFSQVESAAGGLGFANGNVTRGTVGFYMHRYEMKDQLAELDSEELAELTVALGGTAASAFQVAARHGEAARVALEVVSYLMSVFEPSALHDDFGNLWSSEDVSRLFRERPEGGIYALRDA